MVNVITLFPKRKRVVGYNTETGKRTAHALKKESAWQELVTDVWACSTQFQLLRCRLIWAAKVVEDKWPDEWMNLANEEFDHAVKALAAQQAE